MDSEMIVLRKSSTRDDVIACNAGKSLNARLREKLRYMQASHDLAPYRNTAPAWRDLFSGDRSPFPNRLIRSLPAAEVYNLHWTAGFLDYETFFGSLPADARVVWTLHDMYPFTGGCHYSRGCNQFMDLCGCCPQLGSRRSDDPSAMSLLRKRKAMHRLDPARVRVVAPSRWLASEAKKSALFKDFVCQCVPYGIDTETFSPRNRSTAREVFGLPANAKVVMFAAQSLGSYRKGIDLLSAALRDRKELASTILFSVGVGGGDIGIDHPHVQAGQIGSKRLLSFAYSAADVFVCPTREDNLPNVILEAMACGTPVAAFKIGGVPDMIRNNETGLLAAPEDIAGLGEAIATIIGDDAFRRGLSAECRQVAKQEYAQEQEAGNYKLLYNELYS